MQRESSEDRTTPLELFSEEWAYDFILMFVENFILSKLSAYVFLSISISKVPLLSFLTETGNDLMYNKWVDFCEMFIFKRHSSTTKRGKDETEVSLSESLSGQSRFDIFEKAIELLKFSSDVLPTHPGALQGDVLRGEPIRLSNTRATHLRYSSLGMFHLKCKKFCQFTQDIK